VTATTFTELVVLSPVFDDWDAARLVLPRLDDALVTCGAEARVVLIDDGSIRPVPSDLVTASFKAIREIRVLSLRRNVGHQRALAIGLAFVHEQLPCDAVVVMDADGEDDPPDVSRLVTALRDRKGESIVFARRMRRSEGIFFTALYRLYRWVHLVMTGISVQVGNFSVIPFSLLGRLVVVSELWNHYSAAIFQSRIPYAMIPTARAQRLSGTSRMNFVALVAHGMSAVAVFADRVGVRLLIGSLVGLGLTLGTLTFVVVKWLVTAQAASGQLLTVIAVALVLFVQTLAAASLFVLQVLFARGTSTFIPVRDYPFFVASDAAIWCRDATP
jgi:hypothetical protein